MYRVCGSCRREHYTKWYANCVQLSAIGNAECTIIHRVFFFNFGIWSHKAYIILWMNSWNHAYTIISDHHSTYVIQSTKILSNKNRILKTIHKSTTNTAHISDTVFTKETPIFHNNWRAMKCLLAVHICRSKWMSNLQSAISFRTRGGGY